MISPKTTALIATMSLLGAVTPAAFAQEFNFGDVSSSQGVSISKEVNQNIGQSAFSVASTGDFSSGDASSEVNQQASQGFCEQISINQATSGTGGALAASSQAIGNTAFGDQNEQETDCS